MKKTVGRKNHSLHHQRGRCGVKCCAGKSFSHGTSIGTKSAIGAAKVLALTGIDLLTDSELLAQAKADFEKRTEGFEYKSPINAMIKEPVGLPADQRSHGSLLQLKESFRKEGGDDQFTGSRKE